MSEDFYLADSSSSSTELLDARRCQELYAQFNDFENRVFGPDFACDHGRIKPWVDSGCLFYSAICGEVAGGLRGLLALASVFITTRFSRDEMIAGRIADYEMRAWTEGPRSTQPTIYFSSVVSSAPHHLTAVYASLLRDVEAFREAQGISFHAGFSIATGAAGYRHMNKSGFRLLAGNKYRTKYDIMGINAHTASSEFWCGLLRDETAFFPRPEPGEASAAESPFAPSHAGVVPAGG